MRYLPLTQENRQEMLQSIGCESIDDLYANVPKETFIDISDALPKHKGELEVERILSKMANKNLSASNNASFLGVGCYHHHIPATVDHIIQRSEFLTSYTPYQPEISQGTLNAIFEFQTIISLLTGMEVANASMYDGATATAEAALMAMRITRKNNIHIHEALNPEYSKVLDAYMLNHEEVNILDSDPDENSACVIVQTPNFFGNPQALSDIRKKCDETKTLLVVVVTEILSLGLLPAPAEADIVVGEAQSIGVAMSFGGPHLGFFSCKKKYVRQMPGRLCGVTVDKDNKRSFALTLNTREQHIRREKATSNICTNQGLCSLAFTIHMSLLGEDGFKKLAKLNHKKASDLVGKLKAISEVEVINKHFFNEFTIKVNKSAKQVVHNLSKQDIIAGYPVGEDKIIIAVTEMNTDEDIDRYCTALQQELS